MYKIHGQLEQKKIIFLGHFKLRNVSNIVRIIRMLLLEENNFEKKRVKKEKKSYADTSAH